MPTAWCAVPTQNAGLCITREEPHCLLCGSSHRTLVVEAPDIQSGLVFAVVCCQDCGLCYTNPRPSQQTIGQFYPTQYRPHRAGRKPGQRRKHIYREHQPLPLHGQGRLLDVGCGAGKFLYAMHCAGWQVTGIDASAAAVDTVRRSLGLRAFQGTLPHNELQDASLDLITMMHSLEHVHQPLEVLRAAFRLLVPGGKLVVAVPNIDSLAFRWFGSKWYALDLPRHLTHFTPRTLTLMVEDAGFDAGPVEMLQHSEWLRASSRRAGRQRWLRLRPLALAASRYCCWTQQADAMMMTAMKPR
jgi:SAM-dependent methyltransferase